MRFTLLFSLCTSLFLGVGCQDAPTDFASINHGDVPESLSGKYARMEVVDDHLYAVDQTSMITYDISDRANPTELDRRKIGRSIETLFYNEGNLFVGSRRGMFTYSIQENGVPQRRGRYDYSNLLGGVLPCDPVVANQTTAYATLSTSLRTGECPTDAVVESLLALDITDLDDPKYIQLYEVATPRGLSLDGNLLFVCQEHSGMTVFNATDPEQLVELTHVSGITAYDAIAKDGIVTVVGDTELIQYDYSEPTKLVELTHTPYPKT